MYYGERGLFRIFPRPAFLNACLFLTAGVACVILLSMFSVASVSADVVRMKTGKILVGEVSDNPDHPNMVDVAVGKGKITVARDSIEQIDVSSDVEEPEVPEQLSAMEFDQRTGLEVKEKISPSVSEEESTVNAEGRVIHRLRADPLSGPKSDGSGDSADTPESIQVLLAKVIETKEPAEIRSGEAPWRPLQKGDSFSPGDEIRTLQGRVRLFTSNRVVELRLPEQTCVKNPMGTTKSSLFLESGKVWVKIHGEKESGTEKILVQTASASASVKGSLLLVEADKASSETTVSVFDGQVRILDKDDQTELTTLYPQQATSVSESGAAIPARYDGKQLDQWTYWKSWLGNKTDPNQ